MGANIKIIFVPRGRYLYLVTQIFFYIFAPRSSYLYLIAQIFKNMDGQACSISFVGQIAHFWSLVYTITTAGMAYPSPELTRRRRPVRAGDGESRWPMCFHPIGTVMCAYFMYTFLSWSKIHSSSGVGGQCTDCSSRTRTRCSAIAMGHCETSITGTESRLSDRGSVPLEPPLSEPASVQSVLTRRPTSERRHYPLRRGSGYRGLRWHDVRLRACIGPGRAPFFPLHAELSRFCLCAGSVGAA